ncbi:transcriptional regulator [Saccharobesus litoralis]|uniref:Transcriptional regulator n=1 Tax=Saccharobesus litoralis TaxID=2172099 RepID=A0A2S0VWE8_9ALTE|nr:metalloregulator ArsR/SmtB family transcription factor [Saccharobesus litoralis]AWB68546.1 transcriptional regulator [Saccharobesus litoralis]
MTTTFPPVDFTEKASQAAALLKALSNEHRLMVLCLLLTQEMSVGQINEHIELSQSALSQHLAWLRNEGLVKTRKESQTVYYTLDSKEAKAIIGTLHSLYCE